jgi:hypothetical protein
MKTTSLLTTTSKRLFNSAVAPATSTWALQKGRLSLEKLRDKALIDESIESVNVVYPDQYGRLTGLKLNAEYFLDQMQGGKDMFEVK